MKIFFKIFLVFFCSILVGIISCYYIFLSPVQFDKSISKSKAIKDLDKKIYWSFYKDLKQEVTTDFTLEKNKGDTVIYQCTFNRFNEFPKIENINFHFTTGFNGNQVNIYRIGNRFLTKINDFSDNETGEQEKRFKILSQKLVLNQREYKANDSIFGSLEIKFLDYQNNSTNKAVGNFRTILK